MFTGDMPEAVAAAVIDFDSIAIIRIEWFANSLDFLARNSAVGVISNADDSCLQISCMK